MSTQSATTQAPLDLPALETKAAAASLWTIFDYGFHTVLRIVNSLVLTRLLHPSAFGEVTLVSTLIVGISLLSDIGLGPSVIQSRRGDDLVFLNTAWTIQVVRAVSLWLVAVAISWPMSLFYHDPRLKFLLPVLATSTLISGFNSTNLLTLSRHMGVRRLFWIDGSVSVVTLLSTIIWAYLWPSVWAIIGGQLMGTAYRLVISHIRFITGEIANRFMWDKECVTNIVHFGKWIMIGTAFFFFASQADRLILGRLISLSLLGVYGIAYSLSDVPRAIMLALGSKVAYPFIAKIIHLPQEEFRAKFLHYRFYALICGGFLLSLMTVWGHLIILKAYDLRYREAAWMIPILALGLWQTLLYQTTAPVLFSLGKTKYNAIGNASYCFTMLSALPLAFHFFGMFGAVVAIAAGDLPLYVVTQFGATREGVRPLRQDLLTTLIFGVFLGVFFFLRRSFS